MQRKFNIIVACDENNGIGLNNDIPWDISEDKIHFSTITKKCDPDKTNALIMGRNTYLSIPTKFRPLRHRLNVVLSRTPQNRENIDKKVLMFKSLPEAVNCLSTMSEIDKIFVIGGESVYKEALESNQYEKIYLTKIYQKTPECDRFFPKLDPEKHLIESKGNVQISVKTGTPYEFVVLKKKS